jgi:hypothetical protein
MTDLPYIPIVYSVGYDVTRTNTWHNYQASPANKDGSPIGTNWLQMTMLQPGPETAASPSGTAAASSDSGKSGGTPTWLIVLIVVVVVGAIGVLLGRRSRGSRAGGEDADDAPFM